MTSEAISELKALRSPPRAVELTCEAVALLLQKPRGSWNELKTMMNDKEWTWKRLLTDFKSQTLTETLSL